MADNTFNPRITDWDVHWNGNGLGLLNEVNPGIEWVTEPITRGTTGKKVILDEFFVACKSSPKIMIPDISAALILSVCPWIGPSQFMTPSVPASSLYQYAQLLTLHPHDMGATTTEDLNAPKAVPFNLLRNAKRDGDKENPWELEFKIFPVFTKLTQSTPELVYWFLGTVPGSY